MARRLARLPGCCPSRAAHWHPPRAFVRIGSVKFLLPAGLFRLSLHLASAAVVEQARALLASALAGSADTAKCLLIIGLGALVAVVAVVQSATARSVGGATPAAATNAGVNADTMCGALAAGPLYLFSSRSRGAASEPHAVGRTSLSFTPCCLHAIVRNTCVAEAARCWGLGLEGAHPRGRSTVPPRPRTAPIRRVCCVGSPHSQAQKWYIENRCRRLPSSRGAPTRSVFRHGRRAPALSPTGCTRVPG